MLEYRSIKIIEMNRFLYRKKFHSTAVALSFLFHKDSKLKYYSKYHYFVGINCGTDSANCFPVHSSYSHFSNSVWKIKFNLCPSRKSMRSDRKPPFRSFSSWIDAKTPPDKNKSSWAIWLEWISRSPRSAFSFDVANNVRIAEN